MKVTIGEIVGAFLDRIFQPLSAKVDHMTQQVTDLTNAVTALTSAVTAADANQVALKQKLDAALADNVAKATQIASLEAQLAAAQGDPTDAPAILAATTTIQQQTQALADATAANSPTN